MTEKEFIAQTDAIASKWGNISGNDLRKEMFKWYDGSKPADQFTEADVQELANTHARESIRSAFPEDYQKQTEMMEKMGVATPVNNVKVDRKKILEEFGVTGLGHLTDEQIARIAASNKTSFNNMKQVLSNASNDYIKSNAEKIHKELNPEGSTKALQLYYSSMVNDDYEVKEKLRQEFPNLSADFDAIENNNGLAENAAAALSPFVNAVTGGSVMNAYAKHVANPDNYEGDYDGMGRAYTADIANAAADIYTGGVGAKIVKGVARPLLKTVLALLADTGIAGATELGRQAIAGEELDTDKAKAIAESQFTVPGVLDLLSTGASKIPIIGKVVRTVRRNAMTDPFTMAKDEFYNEADTIGNLLKGKNASDKANYLLRNHPELYGKIGDSVGNLKGLTKDLENASSKVKSATKIENAANKKIAKIKKKGITSGEELVDSVENSLAGKITRTKYQNEANLLKPKVNAYKTNTSELNKSADAILRDQQKKYSKMAQTTKEDLNNKVANYDILTPEEQKLYSTYSFENTPSKVGKVFNFFRNNSKDAATIFSNHSLAGADYDAEQRKQKANVTLNILKNKQP